MGQEAKGKARIEGKDIDGRLYLETDDLLFRGGDQRLRIAVKDVKSATAKGGMLLLTVGRKKYEFDIGAQAPRWADKISNPRTLVQKLGVKPESTAAYIGSRDPALLAELEGAAASVSKRLARHDYDFICRRRTAGTAQADRGRQSVDQAERRRLGDLSQGHARAEGGNHHPVGQGARARRPQGRARLGSVDRHEIRHPGAFAKVRRMTSVARGGGTQSAD